ncbi:hypothetical protein Syun_016993 [Stephania yunnanensis]|uniref:Uncharacterized protein n=1 Tax=Stephania yunnanensis TaxID=152371 RepID=A0AAP0J649_9MAGN
MPKQKMELSRGLARRVDKSSFGSKIEAPRQGSLEEGQLLFSLGQIWPGDKGGSRPKREKKGEDDRRWWWMMMVALSVAVDHSDVDGNGGHSGGGGWYIKEEGLDLH